MGDPCRTHGKYMKRIHMFGRKHEGKTPLRRSKRRWVGEIEMGLKIIICPVGCVLPYVLKGRTAVIFKVKQNKKTV
jgi:hypothetical protein